jgi:hypothetical protein
MQVGQTVTVLYDPRRAARSIIYELCGYEVAKAEPAA